MGFDTIQTSEDSVAFDLDYWKAMQTYSTKNKAPESEQLVSVMDDFFKFNTDQHSSNNYTGSNFYVVPNNDTSLPFVLKNIKSPNKNERNAFVQYAVDKLKPSTNYTVSFWVKGNGPLPVSIGRDISNWNDLLPINTSNTLTGEWKRLSYTVNTGSYTSLCLTLGGNSTWGADNISGNYAIYTTNFDWYMSNSYIQRNNSQDYPHEWTEGRENPSTFTHNGTGVSLVMYRDCPTGRNISGRTFTYSIWAKVISGSAYISMSNQNQEGSQKVLIDSVGVWKKYSVTHTFAKGNTTSSVNVHFWGDSPGTILIWGPQVSEGASADNYIPNPTGSPILYPPFKGDIEFSGLQIEEGSTLSNYEPVRKWFLKYKPKTYTGELSNSIQSFSYLIPGGLEAVALSASDNDGHFYGGVDMRCTQHSTSQNVSSGYTPNFSLKSMTSYTTGSSWYKLPPGHDVSSSSIYKQVSGNYPYATNSIGSSLSTVCGGSGKLNPIGYISINIGGTYNGPQIKKYNFTIHGVLFKPVDKSNQLGGTAVDVKGMGMVQKTSGNGRKKFTSVFLREDSSKIYFTLVTPTGYINSETGVAEAPGFLEFFKGVSYPESKNSGWIEERLGNFPDFQIPLYWYVFDKNTDTFIFTQGASDGFVWAVNVNSTYVLKYIQADLVNSPMSNDDGSFYARFAIGVNTQQEKGMEWYAHGPYSKTSSYGSGFGNTFRHASSWFRKYSIVSYLPEVFGDDIAFGATFNSLVYQTYCVGSELGWVGTRGQLKNFYHTTRGNFQGAEGDLLVTEDATKYFNFYKSTGYGGYEISTFVKV